MQLGKKKNFFHNRIRIPSFKSFRKNTINALKDMRSPFWALIDAGILLILLISGTVGGYLILAFFKENLFQIISSILSAILLFIGFPLLAIWLCTEASSKKIEIIGWIGFFTTTIAVFLIFLAFYILPAQIFTE